MPSYTFRRPWIYNPRKKRRVPYVVRFSGGGTTTLDVDSGSYTVTGSNATLLHNYVISASAGSYTVTGSDATLLHHYVLAADAGSVVVSGATASLLASRPLSCSSGAYTVTGSDATFLHNKAIQAASGSVTISGSNASLLYNRIMPVDSGAYTISGANATFVVGKIMDADAGSYTVTGSNASFLRTYVLPAASGSVAVSGANASLLYNRLVSATPGSFAVSGANATFVLGKTLLVSSGSYTVSGANASFLCTRVLLASSGAYSITGADATLSSSAQNDYAALVQATAAANLKGFWRLNESLGGTQAMDSSGNGNHSVALANNTFGISTGLGGSANTGSQFSGSVGSYIKLENEGATGPLGATQFTITCWFKMLPGGFGITTSTGTGGLNMYPLVMKGRTETDSSPLNLNYALGISAGNVLCGDFESTTGTNHPISGGTTILENLWYFAALTYNGSSFKLFLNGAENATAISTSDTPQSNSIQPASIGASFNSGGVAAGAVNGVIDEVAIWNTALSSAQILSLYEVGRANISLSAQINAIALLSGSVSVNRGLFDGEYFDVISTRDKAFGVATTRNKGFVLNADNSKSFNLKK